MMRDLSVDHYYTNNKTITIIIMIFINTTPEYFIYIINTTIHERLGP
jgi:hypothetical protein